MSQREGSLEAPTRHSLDWKNPEFWDENQLNEELERVYDICHGCRRCVSLCQSFPTLFDLVDESTTMEVDGVAKADYMKVVDECYLCDLCYQTKCPYVPPHEWNVDYPHLMLRAKAIKFKKGNKPISKRIISNSGNVGKMASLPVINTVVNAGNESPTIRKVLEKTLKIHRDADLPRYHGKTLRKLDKTRQPGACEAVVAGPTRGKAALFATCYCNYNAPDIGRDLIAVFEHNDISVRLTEKEKCCGMPKLEQGDLDTVDKYKRQNIPMLASLVDDGWDIVAAIPSCVLMFKQELPLMYPDDEAVQKVKQHIFDPFEYLLHRHKAGLLNTDFSQSIGSVAWHVPCHQRVQNIGPKTRQVLELVPGTEIHTIERCSGHDGTYGVRVEDRS
jgi:Fe-S oxidoreductase